MDGLNYHKPNHYNHKILDSYGEIRRIETRIGRFSIVNNSYILTLQCQTLIEFNFYRS